MKKRQTNLTITDEARKKLRQMAQRNGISMAAVVEILIHANCDKPLKGN